ncbi:MAG: hypothetical protein ACMVY4_12310 [Minwuia sp.]|uniref:hypothetical protein n=1 Tax=Minwuia sp. TaxID=2493630 RepID=UPI003A8876C5
MTPADLARQMADHAAAFQDAVAEDDMPAAREAVDATAQALDALAFATSTTPEDVTAQIVGIIAALRSARFGTGDHYIDIAERLAWGALEGIEQITHTKRDDYGSQHFIGPEDDPRAVRNL